MSLPATVWLVRPDDFRPSLCHWYAVTISLLATAKASAAGQFPRHGRHGVKIAYDNTSGSLESAPAVSRKTPTVPPPWDRMRAPSRSHLRENCPRQFQPERGHSPEPGQHKRRHAIICQVLSAQTKVVRDRSKRVGKNYEMMSRGTGVMCRLRIPTAACPLICAKIPSHRELLSPERLRCCDTHSKRENGKTAVSAQGRAFVKHRVAHGARPPSCA
jgi:hypothetical protein